MATGHEIHYDSQGSETGQSCPPARDAESGSGSQLSSVAPTFTISSAHGPLELGNGQFALDLSALVESEREPLGLEVDTDGDDNAASVYAASKYPIVLSSYQSEKPFDDELGNGVDCATLDSAQTIYAEDIDYVYENGRRYCGDYFMPCDEDEQTRQWLVHSVLKQLFDYELTTVPLENPSYILDVGTGIGEWAIDAAEKWPDCEVFGTDIAPLQPTGQVPVNVEFNIEDAEEEWIRDANKFDLVHLRGMSGAFSDWPFIYRQAYKCIRPGGWIEVTDFDDRKAFDNLLEIFAEGSPLHILTRAHQQASVLHGKPIGVGHMDPKLLMEAGFVDIQESCYDMSIGRRENSAYGNKWLLALCLGMEAHFMRLCTKYIGWDGDYVRQLCRALEIETRNMADDPAKAEGFVIQLRVLVGRKPEVPGQWTARALGENGDIHDYSGDESIAGSRSDQTEISRETTSTHI